MSRLQFYMAEAWLPVSKVAKQLGVTSNCIREHCHGKYGRALKHKTQGKRLLVRIADTRTHLAQFGGKRLQLKPGAAPAKKRRQKKEVKVFEGNPHEILERAMNGLKDGAYLSPQHVQAIAAAARELRMKDESSSRAEHRFEAPQVLGYLRGVGEAWVNCTDGAAAAIATRLVIHIKSQFGVDLEAQNIAAGAMLEQFLRTELNTVIMAVNDSVKETEAAIEDKVA